ncbi:hypothetical protein K9N68_33360 [Kovacikia minuta CCNUW1]|uniref:hypothetical protein n=1 Tax=Kovacikia minuta TaxID=2931930 RepID=UPI001CCFC2A0|nr:hypothetical protein [Kovacikia minuta]UBF26334.1 hypothetical protein K9N68_33360 [Kovacikia minuta CCNUW1]
MAKQPKQPQATDVILGGQTSPPVTGAVLGGLEGLQKRFLHLDPNQKLEVMPGILELGEPGIDLLIAVLNDDAISVRYEAYRYLQQSDSETAKSAIAAGIPLKPGDTLYCVYEIPTGYNDETYYLCNSIPEDIPTAGIYTDIVEHSPAEEIDWESLDPEEFDSLMEEWETPKLVSRHLLRETAEEIAELLHQRHILDRDTPNLFEFDCVHTSQFDVNVWRANNGLSSQQPETDWWDMGVQLVEELKTQQQIELLSQLWKETVGRLAVVHEQRIKRNGYFKVTRSL